MAGEGGFGGALEALELGLLVGGEAGWGGRGLEGGGESGAREGAEGRAERETAGEMAGHVASFFFGSFWWLRSG